MATFCKTSQGGINLDNVIRWRDDGNTVYIIFIATDRDVDYSHVTLEGDEAKRMLDILNGICIFDATQERAK